MSSQSPLPGKPHRGEDGRLYVWDGQQWQIAFEVEVEGPRKRSYWWAWLIAGIIIGMYVGALLAQPHGSNDYPTGQLPDRPLVVGMSAIRCRSSVVCISDITARVILEEE